MRTHKFSSLVVVMVVAAALAGQVAFAQQAPTPQGRTLTELWEDFLHYIRVARPDLCRSFGQAILESGAEPRELYLLSVKTPGATSALGRGESLPGVRQIIQDIRKMIEKGHEDLRKDPGQIANSIRMLGGTVRGFGLAARRLAESGEYCLPQLIQKLRDPQTPETLAERITEVLPQLGKQAVRPLSVALQTTDPKLREVIASALARIEYPHAAPRLKELAERQDVLPRTKKLALIALAACAGQGALNKSVAELYYEQGLSYYYQRESVSPDIREPTANVWYWSEESGLTYKSVPREIFCDIYAMRMARLALKHDESFYPAVSLWIAANLKRAADLPEGQADPTYGHDTPSEKYFALASSARYLQDVLARGLKDRNSAVAIGAIEALAKTAGARNLIESTSGGAQPLVEALSYPDRHVRFLAAVSLADALPQRRFTGYQQVMAQLIEALRQTGHKTALVVSADRQQRNELNDAVRAAGYRVIDRAEAIEALAAAHKSAGVEVAVLTTRPEPAEVILELRSDPAFVTLPVLVVGKTEKVAAIAATDGRIVQIAATADSDEIAAGLSRAGTVAVGKEMTPEAATEWALRAAGAIENLGRTSNPVFDITRAAGSLAAALEDEREPIVLAAARALSVMNLAAAQRAIAGLAVRQGVPENVRIAAFNDLSASLRRFGNELNDELAEAVLDVVSGTGSAGLLHAAAQALGAMDLPSEKIKSLILGTSN